MLLTFSRAATTVSKAMGLPTPLQGLIDRKACGMPICLVMHRASPILPWVLPEEIGFVWGGLFKVIAVDVRLCLIPRAALLTNFSGRKDNGAGKAGKCSDVDKGLARGA